MPRYPKQQRLLGLKKASVTTHAHPPTYLPVSQLASLQQAKFDVILIDPPFSSSFTWTDLQDLPIPALSADPSFVLLWVGSGAGDGLERGREVLAKWGFRRCEDIVWVKTNTTSNSGPGVRLLIWGRGETFLTLCRRPTLRQRLYWCARSSTVLWASAAQSVGPQIVGLFTVTSVCTLLSFFLSFT